MKNRLLLVAAFLGLLATSCEKETTEPQQGELIQAPITITASYETGGISKVHYTESGNNISATWESGDEVLVVYDGYVSTLTLSSGAGTASATFNGVISYRTTPTANSILYCFVKDVNNASAVTVEGDRIIYSDAAFQNQDGTLGGAAKCNTYTGMATYGDGTNIRCTFSVNTSMCKFNLTNVGGDDGSTATVEYQSGSTTVAKATISVTSGDNLVYLAVPAGCYSDVQKIVYPCGGNTKECTLSSTSATFAAGHTYSRNITLTRTITWTPSDYGNIYMLNSGSTTIKEITATLSGTGSQWNGNSIAALFGATVTFSSTYTFSKIEITCHKPGTNFSNWSYSGGKLVWQGTPATSVSVNIVAGCAISDISQMDFTVQ